MKGMVVSTMTILISTTSTTAKKIMEVFRYFRIKKGEYISLRLIVSKKHLWKDIKEEELNEAADDLIEVGYIGSIENPEGWRLLEAGDEYLKQRPLPF